MRFAPGAYRWAGLPLAVGGLAGFAYPPAAVVGLLFGVAVLLFFRDPERTPPPEGVVSPADGRISVIREESADGVQAGDSATGDADAPASNRVRVGVFMNVTDVHVNRAPIGGEVRAVEHEPGGHWPAFSKASERNERRRFTFDDHEVVLIAGTVARRTHSYVELGDALVRGERLGHISFGSRVDVLLPPEYGLADLRVEEGETVRAGESVLADEPGPADD